MKNSRSLTTLVLILLILTGCAVILGENHAVVIRSPDSVYSPQISSTVGIPLTPLYQGLSYVSLHYHWTAEYGTFVRWNPPDFRVIDLGNDAITPDGTVYWRYLPEISGEEPAEVVLAVSVVDARTGKVRASAEKTLFLTDSGYMSEGHAEPWFLWRNEVGLISVRDG